MELPFLKNRRNQQGGGGPPLEITRQSDDGGSVDLLDHVIDELWEATSRKDKAAFKEAMRALISGLQEEDARQDQETTE